MATRLIVLGWVSLCAAGRKDTDADTWNSPWVDWVPCDAAASYRSSCEPRKATCLETYEEKLSPRGIGNSLVTGYVKKTRPIFARGCAPIFQEGVGMTDREMKRYGNPDLMQLMQMQHFFDPAEDLVPSVDSVKCAIYALTQPNARLRAKLADANSLKDASLPTAAFAVRVGWEEGASPEWRGLECQAYRESYANSTTDVIHYEDESLLELLEGFVSAGDVMFGAKKWNALVTSDSPGVKAFSLHYLKSRVARTVHFRGQVGHNNCGNKDWAQIRTREDNIEIADTALGDLIMLSEADALLYFSSKFPLAASLRRPCEQRIKILKAYPRHHVVNMDDIVGSTGPEAVAKMAELMGENHVCMADPEPMKACACYIKLGHDREHFLHHGGDEL